MPDELKPVLARQMEVYAGFLEHTDHHVGRLIDAIEDLGVLDNTIVYYIIGDNGASAEGTMNGAFNEMANFNGMAALETPEFMLSKMDELGSPDVVQPLLGGLGARDEHAVPVDQAGRLALGRHPQRHHRALAGRHRGARRAALAVHPRDRRGADRSSRRPGCRSRPWSTASCSRPWRAPRMLYTFNEPDAPERHDLQYFEMFGNRGIYHQGWSAVTKHRTPWEMVGAELPAFDDDVWELYDGSTDFSQAHDLAAEHPEMLAKLQRLWIIEATKYNVLPIDDRGAERLEPGARRPPDPDPGHLAAVLPRHGTAVGEQRGQHQEQVVLGHRRDRRARAAAPRA